ncbi:MAG: BspA family leucine-rich repeat surface protein [Lactobacillus sp.]|nr:BspA family leucine-rich repeat surface protein [Lactobacillus sp.]
MLYKFKIEHKNKAFLASVVIIELIWLLFTTVMPARAAFGTNLTQWPKVSTNLKTQIDSKYAFSPTLSAQTQISVSNVSGANRAALDSDDDANTLKFTPSGSGNMRFTILYTNIGFSNKGKSMDASVVVTTAGTIDWIKATPVGHLQLHGTANNMSAAATVNFLEHGTNTPASVSGHLTFANVNSLKVVSMNLAAFDQIYCAPNTDLEYNAGSGGLTNLSGARNVKGDTVKFTGTFSDKSSLSYSFSGTSYFQIDTGFELGSMVDVTIPKANKTGIEDDTATTRSLTKSDQVPIQVTNMMTSRLDPRTWEIPDLTKPRSNVNNFKNQLLAPKAVSGTSAVDIWQVRPLYTISQFITEKSSGYLSNYQITDKLDPIWTLTPDSPGTAADVIDKITITDESKKTYDSKTFTAKVDSSNNLTIKATEAALKDKNFYGHIYTFVINGAFTKTADNKFPEDTTAARYEAKSNIANASYTIASSNKVNSEDTLNVTNKINYPNPPTLKIDDMYSVKNKINGTISDPLSHGNDINYLDLTITYTDTTGATKTAPLNIETPTTTLGHENRIINSSPGSNISFQANLPSDIKNNDTSTSNQPFTITAEDNYGIKGQTIANLKPWWDVKNGTLTIHDHDINLNAKSAADWPWDNQRADINKVVFETGVTAFQSLDYMFQGMPKLTDLDLTSMDMRQVTSTTKILDGATGLSSFVLGPNTCFPSDIALPLKTADTGNWHGVGSGTKTSPNGIMLTSSELADKYKNGAAQENYVLDKAKWWNLDSDGTLSIYAHNINTTINSLKDWDWYSVKDSVKKVDIKPGVIVSAKNADNQYTTQYMFQDMSKVKKINGLENLDTSKVQDMEAMFQGEVAIDEISGIKNLNTSNVTNMRTMFRYCYKLKSLDLSNVDMSKVENTENMFYLDYRLAELTLSDKTKFVQDPDLTAAQLKPGDTSSTQVSTKWRSVDINNGGTVIAPKGKALTNKDIIALYTNKVGPKETYVWENNWWDFDSKSGTLTIYPHQIDINASAASSWPWDGLRSNITKVSLASNVSAINSLQGMFQGMSSLTSIDGLNGFDTSQVTSMFSMFKDDSSLASLDLSNQFKADKVNDMRNMFSNCEALTKLDVSNFNTPNLTEMGSIFSGCSNLTEIDGLNKFTTDKVHTMDSLFYNDGKLTSVDLNSFNMSSMTKENDIFSGCSTLRQIKLGPAVQLVDNCGLPEAPGDGRSIGNNYNNTNKWQAVGLGDVNNPAGDSLTVRELIAKYPPKNSNPSETYVWDQNWWDVTGGILSIYTHTIDYPYNGSAIAPKWPWEAQDSIIEKVIFKGNVSTANNANLQNMFAHMTNLTTIEGLDKLNTNNATNMHAMFWKDASLTSVDISMLDMTNVKDTEAMFAETKISEITLGKNTRFIQSPGLPDNPTGTKKWHAKNSLNTDVTADNLLSAQDIINKYQKGADKQTYVWDSRWWVLDNNKLIIYPHNITLQADKGTNIKSTDWPWDSYRSSITTADIKPGVKVDSTAGMFLGMKALTSINGLGNLDTAAVTDMSNMFQSDTALRSLPDLNTLNTQNVIDMSGMFQWTPYLTTLDLSNFNTSNVTKMDKMFMRTSWGTGLQTLDISHFDMSKVTSSSNMFTNDTQLWQLTLGPKVQLSADCGLPDAPGSDKTSMLMPGSQLADKHYNNTSKWQAVGNGGVYNPTGDALTVKDLIAKYPRGTINPSETYVWDQRWWLLDNNTLTIYPHIIDVNSTGVKDWPWYSALDDIKTIDIKPGVVAKNSIKSMFYGMKNLTTISGLSNMDTSEVTNFYAMFFYDKKLLSLDLSKMEISQGANTTGIFGQDNSLWKIILGPKTNLKNSQLPAAPGGDTSFPENPNYVSRTSDWQEVLTNDDYHPSGDTIKANVLSNYQGDGSSTHTYVWVPSEAGYLTLIKTPEDVEFNLINYPTYFGLQKSKSAQKFEVDDTRAINSDWQLLAYGSQFKSVNGNKGLTGIEFDYKGIKFGEGTSVILKDHSGSKFNSKYQWSLTDNGQPGIQLDIPTTLRPESGKYHGTITYELRNSI